MSGYETFKTYSGLSFFQDYILPNSTGTKNPLYKNFLCEMGAKANSLSLREMGKASLDERLNHRKHKASNILMYHIMWCASSVFFVVNAGEVPALVIPAALLGVAGAYSALNDMDIKMRIERVLSRREKKRQDKDRITP